MEAETTSAFARTAQAVGMSEAAFRLFITILLGYPIGLIHRHFFYQKPPVQQHLFFATCGLLLGIYNFGIDMFHTLGAVVFVYLLLKTIGGTVQSVIITLSFTLGYLVVGYYTSMTDTYDIVWTMPYCILTLRLTGLAFDLYDGTFPEDKLSKDSKKLALREMPSFLEIAGFTYFPTSFMVGPQFPMRKYKDFVSGKLKPKGQELPDCVGPSIRKFGLGVLYSIMFTFGSQIYSSEYLLSKEFSDANFFKRIFDLGMWAHFALYQYISCWLFTEGACVLIGIGYSEEEKGLKEWNGCSNIDILLFEKAQNFSHDYIASFNTNTNFWVLQYIYKRLRFLNNKYFSQIGVLLFLAIWHGLHSGYYVCFLMEFLSVFMEKEYFTILERNRKFLTFLNSPAVYPFKVVFLKLYTLIFMGPCMLPLSFLSFSKYWPVYKSIYFYQIIVWGFWPIYKPLVVYLLPPSRERTD